MSVPRSPADPTPLSESDERWTRMLEASGAGAWDLDLVSRTAWRSPHHDRIFGYDEPLPEWTYEDFLAHVVEEDRARVHAEFERALAERRDWAWECRIRRADGAVRSLRGRGRARYDGEGRPLRMWGVIEDVSETKAAQEALRDQAALFRSVVEASPFPKIIHAEGGEIVMVNSAWIRLSGYRAEELPTIEAWTRLAYGERAGEVKALIETTNYDLESLTPEGEHTVATASGEERVWDFFSGPVGSDERGRRLVLSTAVDLTERKRAEEALRESEERFRTLADHIAQLAWMADETGWIFWYNHRWFDYTGATLEEMQGWGWRSAHHPDHVERVVEKIAHCFRSGEVWEDTFPLRGRDGRYRWFLSRAVPIRDETGRVTRWFGTNTDVTEQREAEEALRDADRRKDEFLAILAHELRNPLAPIRTGIELMKVKGAPHDLSAARDVIDRQSRNLQRLLDDLLDISRITRGKVRLHKERVRLSAVAKSAVEAVRPLVEASDHALEVALPPESPWLVADPTRLSQVLVNLLNNAARYTQRGGRIGLAARTEDGHVVISVRDDGVGIASENLDRIFEPFAQVHPTHAQGGLGIGLALVKTLVELHGGTVEARSAGKNCGSEFVVRLPIADGPAERAAPERRPAEAAATGQGGLAILVVDDNQDAAEGLEALLRLSGHRTRVAHDGETALEVAEAFRPDVVLLDIGLPRMNGYEVARRIRQQEWGRQTVLLAQTGWGMEEDRRRALEAGFDQHFTKPVDVAALDRLLALIARGQRG